MIDTIYPIDVPVNARAGNWINNFIRAEKYDDNNNRRTIIIDSFIKFLTLYLSTGFIIIQRRNEAMDTTIMTIGTLANKTGVNIETVRYYERIGLIEAPSRSKSGYRHYAVEVVTRIKFIKRAQGMGFSLKEIQELLNLRVDQNTSCGEVKNLAQAKIADVEIRVRDLIRIKAALQEITAMCTGQGPITNCPILDLMEHQ